MNVLITGGAGFIGSNVAKLFLEKGHNVSIVDNLSTGYIINIVDYIKSGKINYLGGDIRDTLILDKAMRGIDVVIHMAASVGRQRSLDNPQLDSEINLIGTINILESMRKNNVKRIVYSSSAAMFGELLTPTIDENHPQNADSPYGVSKLAAEKMILAYCGIYDMTCVCLRYFNIYGINQRFDLYGNVIPIFAKKIFSNEPITIYGDGLQTRDFLNAEDVARANYIAATSNMKSDVFNLGSGESVTINWLAEKMQELTRISVETIHVPERPADVRHCKANTHKAVESMNFFASVPLEDGLRIYLDWYKRNCIN